jgi:hypothetical protein
MRNLFFAVVMVTVAMTTNSACSKESTPEETPVNVDSATITANFSTVSTFKFYDLKNNVAVANTDSASTKWDIGIRQATIIFNSGASGPGQAGVRMVDAPFSDVRYTSTTDFAYDTTARNLAIPYTSWATYNPTTRSFIPIAGKTFTLRMSNGKYGKMEVVSTTYGNIVGGVPSSIIYKIRFVYQEDGSTRVF